MSKEKKIVPKHEPEVLAAMARAAKKMPVHERIAWDRDHENERVNATHRSTPNYIPYTESGQKPASGGLLKKFVAVAAAAGFLACIAYGITRADERVQDSPEANAEGFKLPSLFPNPKF